MCIVDDQWGCLSVLEFYGWSSMRASVCLSIRFQPSISRFRAACTEMSSRSTAAPENDGRRLVNLKVDTRWRSSADCVKFHASSRAGAHNRYPSCSTFTSPRLQTPTGARHNPPDDRVFGQGRPCTGQAISQTLEFTAVLNSQTEDRKKVDLQGKWLGLGLRAISHRKPGRVFRHVI